ncbi:DUF6484 domain-containing protein [Pseudorhodoferax sp.]|uniref:DUF6484 domain-containing protein n=1 Tax=Pseudorhodoferax sp. TaxID=1993553 RepID=UPI0039E532D4
MHPNDLPASATVPEEDEASLLPPLLRGSANPMPSVPLPGVVVGRLLALTDEGRTPLVSCGDDQAAMPARSTVDLHGAHIGQDVLLVHEAGDPSRPIVIGVLRGAAGWPADQKPDTVQVDADGQRLVVSAREQLVLRCGKASITLTKAGKVLIEGSYLLSRSTGVNRVKGGSVQLN